VATDNRGSGTPCVGLAALHNGYTPLVTTPDPQPETTTGLEAGGGVPPGETPPVEGSVSGLSHKQEPASRATGPIFLIVAAVVIVLIVAGVIIGAVQMF
jgi:hypothetical protein